jgi:hypothetical protein
MGGRGGRLREISPAWRRVPGQVSGSTGNGRRVLRLRSVYEYAGFVFVSGKRRLRSLPDSGARGVVGL